MEGSKQEPQDRSGQGRQVIWGALAGLVVVAIVIALLGSPVGALIPVGIAALCLLFFFGGLG